MARALQLLRMQPCAGFPEAVDGTMLPKSQATEKPGGGRHPLQLGITPLRLGMGPSLIPVSNSVYTTVPKVFVPGSVLRMSLSYSLQAMLDA